MHLNRGTQLFNLAFRLNDKIMLRILLMNPKNIMQTTLIFPTYFFKTKYFLCIFFNLMNFIDVYQIKIYDGLTNNVFVIMYH